MYMINMVKVNEFNEAYGDLDGVFVTEQVLHNIWSKTISKHKRLVDTFFPSYRKYILNTPTIMLDEVKDDDVYTMDNVTNIILELVHPSDNSLSKEHYKMIEEYMQKIIAYRLASVFRYSFNINRENEHMWNCQTKSRGKKYNVKVFEAAVESFVRDSTREAEYHYECVWNNIEHTFKHRTSKHIVKFENFYNMVGYAIFNVINRIETRHVQFIITSHKNGKIMSAKRGRAIPYTFISCLYDMLDIMDDNESDVFSIQVSIVDYDKKGVDYDRKPGGEKLNK